MSKFPWWNTTITVYNRFEDSQTHIISWYKKIISDCFWNNVGNTVSINNVSLDTNSIIVRIPKNDAFLDKAQWINLSNDQRANYFTLGSGDIIVSGSVDDVINEYTDGHRSSDLLEKYKNLGQCMIIETYCNNSGAGRGQPHYRATGK